MSVPNLKHIVQAVRDSQVWPFNTKADACAYKRACIVALHAADPNFGELSKTKGQNHCVCPDGKLAAADVALYRPTGQIIDFIASAGFGFPPDVEYADQNAVAWKVGPENEYDPEKRWFAPAGDGAPVVVPVVPPASDGPVDLSDVLGPLVARVLKLEERVQLHGEISASRTRVEQINDRMNAIDEALGKRIDAVGEPPSGHVSFSLLGRTFRLPVIYE